MDVRDLAVDPELVLETARFHLEHPEARPELGDEAALARWDELGRQLSTS